MSNVSLQEYETVTSRQVCWTSVSEEVVKTFPWNFSDTDDEFLYLASFDSGLDEEVITFAQAATVCATRKESGNYIVRLTPSPYSRKARVPTLCHEHFGRPSFIWW